MLKTIKIKRNGYVFQVPDNPFCRYRFSIHPDGSGSGWVNVEAVDVDQPHGKDYLYSQHIAIGIRKRMNQEHSAFADATVGGIHKPGGCAVLGMEITDDCTAPVVGDGTYRGHGLLWTLSKDTSNFGVLWCATKAAGTSTTGDWTVLKMHPDLQWSGQDVTWAGAHEFDASVDISGNVAIDGDLTIDGTFTVGGDAAFHADASFDGTVDFGDGVAFVAEVSVDGILKVDGTASEFGGTVGTALFFDPTAYGGGETTTFPNGLIIKMGQTVLADAATHTFGTAFPNGIICVLAGIESSGVAVVNINTDAVTGFRVDHGGGTPTVHWIAIGW